MLATEFFWHQTIRRYTLAFGLVFSDIYIKRSHPYDVVLDSFKIPITQASKQKFYLQLMQDASESNRPFGILLPRISFMLSSISYDQERQKNVTNRYMKTLENAITPSYNFEPSPWNFHYDMTLWTANEHDAHQAIEQILPYFTPFYMLTINELPTFNI